MQDATPLIPINSTRARLMTHHSDWSDKLEHVLADARIPKEQFATIENEST